MNISSTVHSSVSLLAIDQRVLSMYSNHEITKDFIFNQELVKYDAIPVDTYDPEIPFWFYSHSYQKKFIDVGAVILTNARQEIPCKPTDTSETTLIATTEGESGITFSTPKPISDAQIFAVEEISKKFLDTFFFKTVNVTTSVDEWGEQGVEILTSKSSEIPNSWIITGIALSERFGLGLTRSPAVLNSFLFFYIDFIVPSSIKIGEVVQLEILVVNLFDEDVTADIKFFSGNDKFEVLRPFAYNWTTVPDGYLQNVAMEQRSIHRSRIEIQSKVFGYIELKVSATSLKAGDAVEKQLLVLPEGFPIFENHAEVLVDDNCEANNRQVNLACALSPDAVNGTIQIQASVSGNVFGPALVHIETLIRLPTGCGEQTVIHFVPTILAMDYLTATNKLTPELSKKATEYIQIGYQRLLKYRHADGSFSAFGERDVNGSTWLTAYVIKYIRKAQKYITIDENLIAESLEFIVSKQEPDGSFREDGNVFHKTLQGGTGIGIPFFSYCGVTLQTEVTRYPQYKWNIKRVVAYVTENYDREDIFSITLATYLLYQTGDGHKEKLLEELLPKGTRTPEYFYFKTSPLSPASSADIETTSYVLMILDQVPDLYNDAFKLLRWLVSTQNSRGGFESTHATVTAIKAVAAFAVKFSTPATDLTIDLLPEFGMSINTKINNSNSLMTQTYQLEKEVRKLSVKTTGSGFALAQLTCQYFSNNTTFEPSFDISLNFGNESCDNRLVMDITVRYISRNADQYSNMVVVKIGFPSGFIFDSGTRLAPEIQVNSECSKGASEFYVELKTRALCSKQ